MPILQFDTIIHPPIIVFAKLLIILFAVSLLHKLGENKGGQFNNKTTDVIVHADYCSQCSKLPAHDEELPVAQHGVAPGQPGLLLRVRVAAIPHCGGVHSPAGEQHKYVYKNI